MAIITDSVRLELQALKAEVFFVSRAATKWFNARRSDRNADICLLGGWYWARGIEEYGPFRSPSAAWRDVYYRQQRRQFPPMISQVEVAEAEQAARNLTARTIRTANRRSATR